MGLATAGCLRRIFRLSWLGHQSRLPAPSVGWLRGPTVATGHWASLSSEFMSPTTALWWWCSDTFRSFRTWSAGLACCAEGCCVLWCGGTFGAQAPVGDLGFVDRVAAVVGRGEAGRLTHGAVDVGDDGARPTDHVVVVVAHPGFVAGHGPGRLDPSDEAGVGQGVQRVVDGLARYFRRELVDRNDDRVRVHVWMGVHRGQHGEARAGDPQRGSPQHLFEILAVGHPSQSVRLSGSSQDYG